MSVRLGFIGVGGIAKHHMSKLEKLKEAKIVGVYDVNEEAAAEVAETLGCHSFDQVDDLIDPKRIDALFICNPQFARGELEETAAKKGIHLFAEKPLGIDMETVRRKEEAIIKSGIIHSSGYCLRYLDTVQKAQKYLAGKTIHMVNAYRFGGLHPSRWWRTQELSGGHFVDTATHQVDMVRFVAGEIVEVFARFGRNSLQLIDPEATIFDAGAVNFKLASGAIGNISDTCYSPRHSRAEVEVFGPDFFLQLSKNGKVLTIKDEYQDVTETSEVDAHYEQDRTFIQAVATGSPEKILSNYSDASHTLAVTLAANQSAQANKPVFI